MATRDCSPKIAELKIEAIYPSIFFFLKIIELGKKSNLSKEKSKFFQSGKDGKMAENMDKVKT